MARLPVEEDDDEAQELRNQLEFERRQRVKEILDELAAGYRDLKQEVKAQGKDITGLQLERKKGPFISGAAAASVVGALVKAGEWLYHHFVP